MYKKQQRQQLELHREATREQMSSSPSLTVLLKLSCLDRQSQNQNYQDKKHHHRHPHDVHHSQKYKTRHYFPRCELILFIFLSVIKDSLTTTYLTSYSSSLDVTTSVPQANFLPYFDFDVPRNITVTVGQTGFLHCRVERLGDKDVSWIRKRDLHILTAGSTTYTSDQRFQVLRPENSGNWTLQIKYPQPRDSGIYECQINTEPKMSLSYTFNVVELKATIFGPTDLYVKSGSDINLTCKIMQGPHELGNIFWYKGSEIIDMTANQNEIDSETRITVENDWSDGLTSRLKIRRASSSDTGNYTCVPTIAKSSSVYVHVIIGEHPAAMQHNSSATHSGNFCLSLCCVLFTIFTFCLQYFMCSSNNSNSNNNNKSANTIPIKILPVKETSTSVLSLLSMANATAAGESARAALQPPTTLLMLKTKATTNSDITQSMQHVFSLAPRTKAKLLRMPALLYTNATTTEVVAAIAATLKKIRLLVNNGRITR